MPNKEKKNEEIPTKINNQGLYQRNLHWEEQRKKKILEEQKKIEEHATDGCTFKPQIQAHNLQELRSAR